MPVTHLPYLALTLVPVLLFVALCVVLRMRRVSEALLGVPIERREPEETRRCRYCRRGAAVLVEQRRRYEGMALIQTKLFACPRCGLPHWIVTREPQEWRAVR